MTRRPLWRDLAVALINTAARLAERTICAFPNRTHDPVCPVCKRADCTKEVRP